MTKIIQRHDTAANWTAANPVLAAGEMGVETDTSKFKFGNGTSTWSELAYATSGGGSVDAYTKAETDELLTGKQDKLTAKAPLNIATEEYKELNITVNTNGGLDENYIYSIPTDDKNTNYQCLLIANSVPFSSADTWEIVVKTKYTTVGNTIRVFNTGGIGLYTTSPSAANVQFVGSNGNPTVSSSLLTPGNIVWLKLAFTGNELILSASNNGIDYTILHSTSSTNKAGSSLELGYNENSNRGYRGYFYLTESYYKINGVKYPLAVIDKSALTISSNIATTSSTGVVQPDGTSITVSETGVISGQDVKTFTGYSDTGTLVLKSINGVLQWVAEG